MRYSEGFSDALELFEHSINSSLKRGIKSKRDMTIAFDNVITTLYVAKLALGDFEEEMLESMFEEHIGTQKNFGTHEFDDLTSFIYEEIFGNTKGGK